jgi:hypothetical protein
MSGRDSPLASFVRFRTVKNHETADNFRVHRLFPREKGVVVPIQTEMWRVPQRPLWGVPLAT